jgi:hypothetical protein
MPAPGVLLSFLVALQKVAAASARAHALHKPVLLVGLSGAQVGHFLRDRGRHTICSKSHVSESFSCLLPLEAILKEGSERKIPYIRRSRSFHAQTAVCESL